MIAARRCRASALAPPGGGGGGGDAAAGGGDAAAGARALTRVVHVGDAPADVLAARACAERGLLGDGVCARSVAQARPSFGGGPWRMAQGSGLLHTACATRAVAAPWQPRGGPAPAGG